MTYMAGYYNLLLLPFTLGASVVVDRAFDARSLLSFWTTVGEHGADVLWLVPTIMAMLLKIDRGDEGRALLAAQIKLVVCGTAPLSPELRAQFEERYGVAVHDSYGLSETLFAAVSTPARPAAAGAVGTLLDGIEMAVRPIDGAPDGELLIRSPDTMVGYLDEGTDVRRPQRGRLAADAVTSARSAPTARCGSAGARRRSSSAAASTSAPWRSRACWPARRRSSASPSSACPTRCSASSSSRWCRCATARRSRRSSPR